MGLIKKIINLNKGSLYDIVMWCNIIYKRITDFRFVVCLLILVRQSKVLLKALILKEKI